MEEEWKQIPGYEGLYDASNTGFIRSLRKKKVMKAFVNNNGYLISDLYKDGFRKKKLVSRLVASAFIEGFEESLQVDHINGDKLNNSIDNLRMATFSQNQRSFAKLRKGRSSKYRGIHFCNKVKKWIAKIYPSRNIYIGRFDTEEEAALAWNEVALSVGFEKEALNKIPEWNDRLIDQFSSDIGMKGGAS